MGFDSTTRSAGNFVESNLKRSKRAPQWGVALTELADIRRERNKGRFARRRQWRMKAEKRYLVPCSAGTGVTVPDVPPQLFQYCPQNRPRRSTPN